MNWHHKGVGTVLVAAYCYWPYTNWHDLGLGPNKKCWAPLAQKYNVGKTLNKPCKHIALSKVHILGPLWASMYVYKMFFTNIYIFLNPIKKLLPRLKRTDLYCYFLWLIFILDVPKYTDSIHCYLISCNSRSTAYTYTV